MIATSNQIHPTAIIGEGVVLGDHNIIGPHCVLEGKIRIGNHNHFRAGVVLSHQVEIGDHNQFFPYVTIGFQGEMGSKGDRLLEDGWVKIGDYNTLREYTNVHSPVRTKATLIGNHCYIMNKVYIAHDCKIHDHVIITAGNLLAGTCTVYAYANLGMGSATHQRKSIGESAMIGMQAANKKDIPPFAVVTGVPSRILKFNRFGAKRRGFEEKDLEYIDQHFEGIIKGIVDYDHAVVKSIRAFYDLHPDALRQFR